MKNFLQLNLYNITLHHVTIHRIVLKLGLARQVDPGLEPDRVEEKTRCDPATRSRPGCKPVDFFFTRITLF
jgi:hypothetical protein